MERMIIKLSMFHTLALGVLSIWFGDWLRAKFPFLKKYCLPGAVVGQQPVLLHLLCCQRCCCQPELAEDWR